MEKLTYRLYLNDMKAKAKNKKKAERRTVKEQKNKMKDMNYLFG